jgi:hypothetical protein
MGPGCACVYVWTLVDEPLFFPEARVLAAIALVERNELAW